jgi:hypothetical protein
MGNQPHGRCGRRAFVVYWVPTDWGPREHTNSDHQQWFLQFVSPSYLPEGWAPSGRFLLHVIRDSLFAIRNSSPVSCQSAPQHLPHHLGDRWRQGRGFRLPATGRRPRREPAKISHLGSDRSPKWPMHRGNFCCILTPDRHQWPSRPGMLTGRALLRILERRPLSVRDMILSACRENQVVDRTESCGTIGNKGNLA